MSNSTNLCWSRQALRENLNLFLIWHKKCHFSAIFLKFVCTPCRRWPIRIVYGSMWKKGSWKEEILVKAEIFVQQGNMFVWSVTRRSAWNIIWLDIWISMQDDLSFIVTCVRKVSVTLQTTRITWISTQVLCTGAILVQKLLTMKEVEISICLCILVFIGSSAISVVKDLMTSTFMTNTVTSIDEVYYTC